MAKKPNQRKNWQSASLNNLIKKFEDLSSRPLEEPKETDSKEDKKEFIAAKNFISKMRKVTLDVQQLLISLVNYGYVVFAESLPKDKIKTIC